MFQMPDAIDVVLISIVALAAVMLYRQIQKMRTIWHGASKARAPKAQMMQHDFSTGEITPVMQTEGGKLFAKIITDRCPDCNGKGFYAGPRGGISQNIYCQNRECRSAFNVTVFTETEGTVERIGKKDPEWYVGASL
jgi:hypothetical protein